MTTTRSIVFVACLGACSGTPFTAQEGNALPYFQVHDYRVNCLNTPEPVNQVFRNAHDWSRFYATHYDCVDENAERVTTPPDYDFDRFALIVVALEGNCAYSSCKVSGDFSVVYDIEVHDGNAQVHVHEPRPEELGYCLACVQPHEHILVENAIVDAFPVTFSPRSPAETLCPAGPM